MQKLKLIDYFTLSVLLIIFVKIILLKDSSDKYSIYVILLIALLISFLYAKYNAGNIKNKNKNSINNGSLSDIKSRFRRVYFTYKNHKFLVLIEGKSYIRMLDGQEYCDKWICKINSDIDIDGSGYRLSCAYGKPNLYHWSGKRNFKGEGITMVLDRMIEELEKYKKTHSKG